MNVADTRCRKFCVSSRMRTPTQTRALIESPRVRAPYARRCKLPAETPLRTAAHIQYRSRYRSASGHCPPRSRAPIPSLVNEDPGTAHRLTLRALGPAHRDVHYRHNRAIWKPSPPIASRSVQTGITDRRNIQPSPLPTGSFRPDRSRRRITHRFNPRAISGEITPPSGTRACDMPSTGTASGSVFAQASLHFDPCAGKPQDDDPPRRTDWDRHTLAADTSAAPASVGLATSGHSPVSNSLSRPSPTVDGPKA